MCLAGRNSGRSRRWRGMHAWASASASARPGSRLPWTEAHGTGPATGTATGPGPSRPTTPSHDPLWLHTFTSTLFNGSNPAGFGLPVVANYGCYRHIPDNNTSHVLTAWQQRKVRSRQRNRPHDQRSRWRACGDATICCSARCIRGLFHIRTNVMRAAFARVSRGHREDAASRVWVVSCRLSFVRCIPSN